MNLWGGLERISGIMLKYWLKATVFSFLYLFTLSTFGQRIDNTASFRSVADDNYIRFHYDNDFFRKTDYYYTQGYQLEMAAPILRKNPVTKLLLQLKEGQKYGLAFEHYGFTPTSIRSDQILYGDRPFAGIIMLKSFAISVNSERRERLTATLSTGMIGPVAFAGRMQATIHRWSGDVVPHGWQYQIGNDLVINYEVSHEKELLNAANLFSLHSHVRANLGTLSDRAQAGVVMKAGKFDSVFGKSAKKNAKTFQLYAYYQPLGGLVGYDATLQGGVFNRNNPYTLQANQLNRLTFQNGFGVVANFWKIYLEYSQTFVSKEFKSGEKHSWGGVKMGYSF